MPRDKTYDKYIKYLVKNKRFIQMDTFFYDPTVYLLKGGQPVELHSVEGREWLATSDGWNWLMGSTGKDWLETVEGRLWLRTRPASDWLYNKDYGRNWIFTDGGIEWLRTYYGYVWLNTRVGDLLLYKLDDSFLHELQNNEEYSDSYLHESDAEIIFYIEDDSFELDDDSFELDDDMYGDMTERSHIKINIDGKSQDEILNTLLTVFIGEELKNYIDHNIEFKTGITIDLGGVQRQVYTDLFYHYFRTQDITLFNNEFIQIEEITNVPKIKISIPSPNYFKCDNIRGLGNIAGYISHLVFNDRINLGIGLEFDNYILSMLLEKKTQNKFINNYCEEFAGIIEKTRKIIHYNNIHYGSFPIINNIIHMLSIYCNKSESQVYDELNLLCSRIHIPEPYKTNMTIVLKNAIINECSLDDEDEDESTSHRIGYKTSIQTIDGGIPFNRLIQFLLKLFELVIGQVYDVFLSGLKNYMIENNISTDNRLRFISPLFMDKYQTKEELITNLITKLSGNGRNKLIEILPLLTYQEIRDLLKFWSGNSKLLDNPYNVIFVSTSSKYPTSSTCGFLLKIPHIPNDELFENIKVAIKETTFGFA